MIFIKEWAMNCGHCGKEANIGYTVCSGCGAHYRADGTAMFSGVVSGGAGLFLISDFFIGGVFLIAMGVFLVKTGSECKWYRKNA